LQQNAADASRGRVSPPEYELRILKKDRDLWTVNAVRLALWELAEGISDMDLIIRKFPQFELSELDRTANAFNDHIEVSGCSYVRNTLMPLI
jgi:hypothetical protein